MSSVTAQTRLLEEPGARQPRVCRYRLGHPLPLHHRCNTLLVSKYNLKLAQRCFRLLNLGLACNLTYTPYIHKSPYLILNYLLIFVGELSYKISKICDFFTLRISQKGPIIRKFIVFNTEEIIFFISYGCPSDVPHLNSLWLMPNMFLIIKKNYVCVHQNMFHVCLY